MTQETASPRRWINPRVALILLALLILICGSVIATDIFSIRDRHMSSPDASQPATQN
ncbi:MAG TPA: hypothetical protein VGN88_03165 [Phycisphaerae bacterium]|jgi:hypothetical protein